MTNRKKNIEIQHLDVEFYKVEAGWLRFFIETKEWKSFFRFSVVHDPILDLKYWLESIAIGVQQTSYIFDSEGEVMKFDFQEFKWKDACFLISEEEEGLIFTSYVSRRQLVEAFYLGLLKFASSDAFVSEEWEVEYGYERLCKTWDTDLDSAMNKLLELNRSELIKLLFDLNPRFSVHFPDAGSPYEEAGFLYTMAKQDGKKPEGLRMERTPILPEIPEDYNYWSRSKKELFLHDKLEEEVSAYSGTKIDDFRSVIIETYLRKDEK